jgi:hypothetical protein
MPIVNLFSRRKRQREMAGKTDVYHYDDLPGPLRVQITNLWKWATGPVQLKDARLGMAFRNDHSWALWESIEAAICHEKGLHGLARGDTPFDRCASYFLACSEIDDLLDLLELSFVQVGGLSDLNDYQRRERHIRTPADLAIEELNFRMREAGVGYQFESGEIIRVDSEYIHSEVVKRALTLLGESGFEGPQKEFLQAHELYRQGPNTAEDAITNALKAFESTLKVVCDRERWKYPENATAAPLIKIVFDNGLLPAYLNSSLGSLQSLMTGLPTVRNKSGGHGRGSSARTVPGYLVAYALHLAATNIVFVVEAHRAHQKKTR